MPKTSENTGNVQEQQSELTPRRVTRENLLEAVVAARNAAESAEHAAHAAAVVADHALAALESEVDEDAPEPIIESEEPVTGPGPSAMATGHGMLRSGTRSGSRMSFEQFMAALQDPIRRAGPKIRVTEITGWIKIEGQQGHKLYVSKTKTGVSRVESTLSPEMIDGALPPDRRNGRIASWIPAQVGPVADAIDLLADLAEPIPRR